MLDQYTSTYALAVHRCAELKEFWQQQPGNHPPPRYAPDHVIHEYHQRWLASKEHAHCGQILRNTEGCIHE